jgi:ribosome-associated toxin RatA of RatAB toxin-antitoxin module
MSTTWRVITLNSEQSLLLLEHDYSLCDEVTGQVAGVVTRADAERFIGGAIDANSEIELGNIKAAVERVADHGSGRDYHASHTVICAAPADSVYRLIRDTGNWPLIFDACLGATRLEGDATSELVRIEAIQDDRRVSWDTRRRYFDAIHRIDYHLPVPMPFVESMRGQWRVVPLGPERCLLTVDRSWRMLADVTGIRPGIDAVAHAAEFVGTFVRNNAEAEMLSIRAFVEDRTDGLTSVTTRFRVPHAPDEVFAVFADVAAWPQVLPQCESLSMCYDDAMHQDFVMRVRTPRGAGTSRYIRHCDDQALTIEYSMPEPGTVLLHRHQGSWRVRSVEGGSEVITRRTVLLNDETCTAEFGTRDARLHKRRVRELLEQDSRMTVEACTRWLDNRRAAAPKELAKAARG